MRQVCLVVVAVCAAILFCPTNAVSQEHFTNGAVVRIILLDIKPGKGEDFWRDMRQNLKPIYEEYKKAGIIKGYSVSTKSTVDEPGDWDVAIALEYANWAALDDLGAKTDPVTLKVYGSAEARRAANMKRPESSTMVASFLMRNITLKDLAR